MIYLAADHKGFALKEKIKKWLSEWNLQFEDCGALALDPQDDYPDFIGKAAAAVSGDQQNSKAIVLGMSGQGEAIVANKFKGVRAMVYYGGPDELVKLSREHNDANVLSLGAGFVDEGKIKEQIKLWLETPFTGEERHARRLRKIAQIEETN